MSESTEKQLESLNEELAVTLDRYRSLERVVEKLREENELMVKALNRRHDQAVSQLKLTFQTIHKLAGGNEYDLTDEQTLILAVYERMLERIKIDRTWSDKERENKFTKWTHVY